MEHPRIVILDGATLNPGDNPWADIEAIGTLAIYDRTQLELIVERSRDADVLVVNKVKLTEAVLKQLAGLKLIAVTATGYDCVDVNAAKRLGISVCNVPVYGTESVAQHTFALIMHLCHRIDLHDSAVHAGEWTRSPDFSFWKTPLVELAGLKLGMVGYGRIGRRVAELGHAFGMQILAHARHQKDVPAWEEFRWAELDDLFSTSDIISLHCPLTPDTKGLINRQSLAKFKPTAFLVNTSRGSLIVEADLAAALNAGQIAAAALDVLSVEPPPADNPLLSARNCVITPHQAWATLAARQRLMRTTASNIRALLAGRPQNVVG
jgi:glycerate dehydrogenase